MSGKMAAISPRTRRLALASGLLVVAALCVVLWARRDSAPGGSMLIADGDPRLTFDTPYLNVRPEVKYVGDAACAGCHAEHTRTYHQHPMGRSFAPVHRDADGQRFDSSTPQTIDVQGFQLAAERRG